MSWLLSSSEVNYFPFSVFFAPCFLQKSVRLVIQRGILVKLGVLLLLVETKHSTRKAGFRGCCRKLSPPCCRVSFSEEKNEDKRIKIILVLYNSVRHCRMCVDCSFYFV